MEGKNYDLFKKEFEQQITNSLRDIKNYRSFCEIERNNFYASLLEENLYKSFNLAKNYQGEDKAKLLFDVIELSTKQGNITIAGDVAKMLGINLDIFRLDKILKFNIARERFDSVRLTLQYIPVKFRIALVNLYARELIKLNKEKLANSLISIYMDINDAQKRQGEAEKNQKYNQKKN
jgi:hypothetical protein